MTSKEEKIEKTLKDEKAFKITETDKHIFYHCKGVSGKIYDILYFKESNEYNCTCKNMRKSECYHILAIKRSVGDKEVNTNENFEENYILPFI